MKTFIFFNKPLNRISVQFMKKVAKETVSKVVVTNAPKNVYPKQGMANKYSGGNIDPKAVKPDGNPAEKHVYEHIAIKNNSSGKIIGFATSSKKINGHKISNEKIDGSFTPKDAANLKSQITNDRGYEVTLKKQLKRPMMDDNGFTIPSDKKGGQFVAFAKIPIETTPEVFKSNAAAKIWCDKHENKIEALEKIENLKNVSNGVIKLSKNLEEK